jgi:hypothetical protein
MPESVAILGERGNPLVPGILNPAECANFRGHDHPLQHRAVCFGSLPVHEDVLALLVGPPGETAGAFHRPFGVDAQDRLSKVANNLGCWGGFHFSFQATGHPDSRGA